MDVRNTVVKEIDTKKQIDYVSTGVNAYKEEYILKNIIGKRIKKTFAFRQNRFGAVKEDVGFFANVIDIGNGMGLALSTDGVGTKILIAQMMNRYNTIGIDCIAMNVNDIICVGAEPIAMLDYLAIQGIDDFKMLDEIFEGLVTGAELSKITIPGGETAQTKDMIKGTREGSGFDLVGTAIGSVPLDRIIMGQNINEGDVIIGLRSSGVHSNGLTLARKVFFEYNNILVDQYFPELGRTLGEELLEPTHIYVPEIVEIINSKIDIKALVNITSDGFLNLTRVVSDVGYIIEYLPEPHPIFPLIKKYGNVLDEEMFKVFNMGIGFCIIVTEKDVDKTVDILNKHNVENYIIGYSVKDIKRKVSVKPYRLIGQGEKFHKE